MLTALLDGRALAAGETRATGGLSPATASTHLARLLDAASWPGPSRAPSLLRLAGHEVAAAIEALSHLGAAVPVRSLHQSREAAALAGARTLLRPPGRAGRRDAARRAAGPWRADGVPGVTPMDAEPADFTDAKYTVTEAGTAALAEFGVDVPRAPALTAPVAGACLDWTQRRPHLNGRSARRSRPACWTSAGSSGAPTGGRPGEPGGPGRAGGHVRLGHGGVGSMIAEDLGPYLTRILHDHRKRDWKRAEPAGRRAEAGGRLRGAGGVGSCQPCEQWRQWRWPHRGRRRGRGQGRAQAELGADVAARWSPAAPLWPRPSRRRAGLRGQHRVRRACRHPVGEQDLTRLQAAIIRSHAAATGDPLDDATVEPCCCCGPGPSQPATRGPACPARRLLQLLSLNLLPVIPGKGSVGASGDRAQARPLAQPLIGEGRLRTRGTGSADGPPRRYSPSTGSFRCNWRRRRACRWSTHRADAGAARLLGA